MSESRSAPARPLRPTKGAAVALHSGLQPGEALRLIVRNCVEHFSANAPGIDGPRPVEFLHQARVALRRLRSVLRLVRPPEAEVTRLRKETKWLAGEPGEAREVHRRHKHLIRLSAALAHGTPQERHAARVVAKRLRYVADHFGPLLDAKAAKRYLRALAALQETLGILNDLANAERLLALLPAAPAAARLILERSRATERKNLAAARSAMKRLGTGRDLWKR